MRLKATYLLKVAYCYFRINNARPKRSKIDRFTFYIAMRKDASGIHGGITRFRPLLATRVLTALYLMEGLARPPCRVLLHERQKDNVGYGLPQCTLYCIV